MAGTSYTRQSTLTDGDTITSALFNAEYNQLVTAFSYAATGTTGHQHDGGAGEGGNIEIIGDQDFLNKIVVDSSNNRWSVFVQVGGSAVEQVRIEDGVVYPVTDSDVDLGTNALRFKNAYIDSLTATGNLTVGGNITVTGNVDVDGIVEFDGLSGTGSVTVTDILDQDDMSGDSATALATQQSIKAYVDAQQDTVDTFGEVLALSNTTAGTDISVSTDDKVQFRDAAIYINSSADGQLDIVADTEIQIAATTIDINGAVALNGAVTGATNITLSGELDAATGDFSGAVDIDGALDVAGTTNLDVVDIDGAVDMATTLAVAGNVDFNGDLDVDGTTNLDVVDIDGAVDIATTLTVGGNVDFNGDLDVDGTIEFDAISGTGSVTVTDILDQDDMSGNSATALATQQSIKAYVDAQQDTVDTLAEILALSNTSSGTNVELTTTDKVQFRDSAIYINSSADGQLDIVADTEIQIAATTIDINGAINASGEIIAASLDISGNIDVDGVTNLDVVDIDGAVNMASTLQVDGAATFTTEITANGGIALGDNDKATFGAGDDLEIYHSGTHSYIKDVGTGNLNILASTSINLLNGDSSDYMARFVEDGGVTLYYDGSSRLATASGGVLVTGELTATSLDISGDIDVDGTTNLDVVDIDGAVDMASTLTVGTTIATGSGGASGKIAIAGNTATSEATHISFTNGAGAKVFAVGGGQSGVTNNGFVIRNVTDNTFPLVISDAGAATFTGVLTANAGVVVDNFTLDGTTLALSSGSMTLDSASQIILDAAGGNFQFSKSGTEFARIFESGSDFYIYNPISDKDIKFYGNDGGTSFTALTLDMSAAGEATFNAGATFGAAINAGGTITGDDGLIIDGGTGNAYISVGSNTGSWVWKNYQASHKLALEDSDGTGEVLNFSTTGAATFSSTIAGTQIYSNTNGNRTTGGNIRLGITTDDATKYVAITSTQYDSGTETEGFALITGTASSATANSVVIGGGIDEINAATAVRIFTASATTRTGVERLKIDETGNFIFNETSTDVDFRVESNGNANMLFVDGGANKVSVGTTANSGILTVGSSLSIEGDLAPTGSGLMLGDNNSGSYKWIQSFSSQALRLNPLGNEVSIGIAGTATPFKTFGGAVFNEDGVDADFRVESNGNTHALFVDGGNDQVVIGSSTPITGSASNIPLVVGYSTGPAVRFYSNQSASRIATGGITLATYGSNKYSGYQLASNGGGMWTTSSSAASNYLTGGAGSGTVYLGNFSQDPFENTSVAFVEYANFNNTGVVFNETSLDRDFRVESNANGYALFVDGGTDTVSVGTAATDAKFRVDASNADLRIGYGSGYNYFDADVANVYRVGTSNVEVMKMTTGETVLNETGADRDFRVESDGNSHMLFVDGGNNRVGINNSAPSGSCSITGTDDSINVLRVIPRVLGSGLAASETTAIMQSQKAVCLDLNRFYSHGTIVQFRHNNDDVGRIDVNGTSTTYVTSSDARLKENIADADDAGSKLDAIQVRQFDWKVNGSHQDYGMVAQELQTVAPEAVSAPENPEEMMGVDYSKLVPMLIKEIQSLRQRVAQLEE